ncbi:MAG: hypothetical protein HY927_16875 [Elusimicrobia bacterium]|nr:hypothetical protein [Elusimicrobiota bacterium]
MPALCLLLLIVSSARASTLTGLPRSPRPAAPSMNAGLPSLSFGSLRTDLKANLTLGVVPGVAPIQAAQALLLPSPAPIGTPAAASLPVPAAPDTPAAALPASQAAADLAQGGQVGAGASRSPLAGDGLRLAATAERLEAALPGLFDGSRPDGETDPVRADYARFLGEVGFRDYPAIINANLRRSGLTDTQRKVLEFNARRYRSITAARDLAALVMAGLAEQGYAPEALGTATELAARLLTLQPLDPPSSLPPEVARRDKDGIREWLVAVTVQRLSGQLVQVVSDAAKASIPPALLKAGTDALGRGEMDAPAAREVAARVGVIKDLVEQLLITAYTDAETGQTRYAGRAMAASLVRFSRANGRPEVEDDLRRMTEERGAFLENFIGDTLVLPDRSSSMGFKRIKVRTGDFLGERSGGREAAEITFGVRPPRSLWWKAFRQKLLGHPLGLWANPTSGLDLKPGQPVRNRLKQLLHAFKGWLAGRRFLLNGYSHVGMASLEESDGVVMAWALDNYPNAGEGGIRKIGIAEQFAQHGPFLKLGVSRLDADKVWDSFHAQAAARGYMPEVYKSGADPWPSLLSREEYDRLLGIPRSESGLLLAELSRRAAGAIEAMMARLGVGFAYGFVNEVWRAYCSSTMMLGLRMGGQFEVQDAFDHWHPLVRLMKRLGLPGAKDQKTDGRIIWPGSLFIDPKVARHEAADYPAYREAGRVSDPYTMPAYVEMDPSLTRDLLALARLSGRDIAPDKDIITAAILLHLDDRARKSRAKAGYASGAATPTGYSAGLDRLLREAGAE